MTPTTGISVEWNVPLARERRLLPRRVGVDNKPVKRLRPRRRTIYEIRSPRWRLGDSIERLEETKIMAQASEEIVNNSGLTCFGEAGTKITRNTAMKTTSSTDGGGDFNESPHQLELLLAYEDRPTAERAKRASGRVLNHPNVDALAELRLRNLEALGDPDLRARAAEEAAAADIVVVSIHGKNRLGPEAETGLKQWVGLQRTKPCAFVISLDADAKALAEENPALLELRSAATRSDMTVIFPFGEPLHSSGAMTGMSRPIETKTHVLDESCIASRRSHAGHQRVVKVNLWKRSDLGLSRTPVVEVALAGWKRRQPAGRHAWLVNQYQRARVRDRLSRGSAAACPQATVQQREVTGSKSYAFGTT